MEIMKLITPLITTIVVIILGELSKKYEFVNKNLLPIQNNIIAIVVAIIEYAITKDFNALTVASGLFASGVYDVYHGANKTSETKQILLADSIEIKEKEVE